VRWHLERAWAPLLFRDEAPPERLDVVGPPERSASARAKEGTHRTPEGLPVQDFRGLLKALGTLVRSRVIVGGTTLELLTEPNPLQARALELASVSPLAK